MQIQKPIPSSWPLRSRVKGLCCCSLLATLTCVRLFGQGTVHFAANSSTPITSAITGNPVSELDGIKAALYWSPAGASNFVQLGSPVNVGTPLPGVFVGGTRVTGPETPGGEKALFQVRAWERSYGDTYEQALNAQAQNGRRALVGQSAVFEITTGNANPPTPPALITAYGLTGFQMNPVISIITCSTNRVVECTGALTPVTYITTAESAGSSLPVTCVPPSGTLFRVGISNVVCTAMDVTGGTATCSFTVTVQDTTPPTVSCSTNLTLLATNLAGAVGIYTASALDACGLASFACSPPSGSVFPLGINTVTCTAVDSAGHSASCAFAVTVQEAPGQKFDCLAQLVGVRAATPRAEDQGELDDAIDHLTRSLDSNLWIDENHLQRRGGDKVFDEEAQAVHELGELLQDKHSSVPANILHSLIDCLVGVDRLLAVIAVDEGEAAGLKPKKIAEDREQIGDGDDDDAQGKYENAIHHYANAWKHAVRVKLQPPQPHLASPRLTFLGVQGEIYTVQVSPDMVHWTTIGTATANEDGEAGIDDPSIDGSPARFYRVITP